MKILTIVCGSPGAGKSIHGKKLALASGAALLDIDTCTERLIKVAMREAGKDPNDRDSSYFKGTYRAEAYELLFSIAEENLVHTDVIIIGPFTKELRDPAWLSKLRSRFKTEVVIHYVYCSPETRYERIFQRAEGRDRAKLSDWIKSQEYFGDEQPPGFEHVFVDTSATSS